MFRQGGQRVFSSARERRSTADRRLAAWGGSATAAEKPLPRKGPEVGSRGITVNNIEPGPIDTDLNPAAGDWAVPQLANTALKRLRARGRRRRVGGVRRRSGSVLHHRREPHRRRWHQRLMQRRSIVSGRTKPKDRWIMANKGAAVRLGGRDDLHRVLILRDRRSHPIADGGDASHLSALVSDARDPGRRSSGRRT